MRVKICIFFVLSVLSLQAQNHLWSQQYGANNTLVAGANIASIRDNAAIYYNPGAMGFVENQKISLSANIYEIDLINLKNVAGNGISAKSTRTLIYPQFAGGTIFIKKVPKLKIFYGFFTRNRSSFRYNVQYHGKYEISPNSPGAENYGASLNYDFNSIETWAGLGFGYKVNDILSAGVSIFGTYTNVENSFATNVTVDSLYKSGNSTPYIATVNESAYTRMDHFNLVCKLGLAADFKHVKLGLAFTLPSQKIWGTGTLSKTNEAYNLTLNNRDTSFHVADYQNKLSTNYKTVPSISLGGSYISDKVKVHVSMEYFFGSGNYLLMQGDDNTQIKDFLKVTSHSRPIVNAAIGGSFKIKEKYKILAGFRTDFNNRMNFLPSNMILENRNLAASYWHMLHWTLGVSYNRGANDITIGLDLGTGVATDRMSVVNFANPEMKKLLEGEVQKIMRTQITNIGVLIGYTYFFKGSPRSSEPLAKRFQDW